MIALPALLSSVAEHGNQCAAFEDCDIFGKCEGHGYCGNQFNDYDVTTASAIFVHCVTRARLWQPGPTFNLQFHYRIVQMLQ